MAIAIATLSVIATWAAVTPEGSATASPPSQSPMSLALNATFPGSSLNTSQWDTCYPWYPDQSAGCTNTGNPQEEEWYLPSQDQVSGGALHMVADQTPTQGTDANGAPKTYPYTSGMVTTYHSLDFTYGYVQVSARIPGGTGTWPALWLLPQSEGWPPEIDMMENLGTNNTIWNTVIWGSTPSGPEQYHVQVISPSDLTTGFHTYGLLWQPGSLTWYLDGSPVSSYTGKKVPKVPMYFLADLAVNGPAVSGSSFDIQSVQIYKGLGSVPPGANAP